MTIQTKSENPVEADKLSRGEWPAVDAARSGNRIERPLAVALVQSRSFLACCTPVHARGGSFQLI